MRAFGRGGAGMKIRVVGGAVVAVAVAVALAFVVRAETSSDDADGLWLMTSMTADGQPVDIGPVPLFLIHDGGRLVSADGRCEGWFFKPDGDFDKDGILCSDPERSRFDGLLGSTFGNVTVTSAGLVLQSDRAEARYQRFIDPSPQELYSALTDPEAVVNPDEMSVHPVFGTPAYSTAARLASVDGTDYFVAVDGGVVCLVRTVESVGVPHCSETCDANFVGNAMPLWGPAGLLDPAPAVLIPDQFVEAAEVSGIGESIGNVLVLGELPDEAFVLTNEAGETYAIFPWGQSG